MLSAIPGSSKHSFVFRYLSGGPDLLRIKIWDKTTGAVIFDTQMGASDAADSSTSVGSGSSIVIQK